MLDFDYSNSNIAITWGKDFIILNCNEMGIIGNFNMRVYTSSKAGFIPRFNNTSAFGHYKGVRGKDTRIFADVSFNN